MSSLRLTLAFLTLFLAGYLVGSDSQHNLLQAGLAYIRTSSVWDIDLLKRISLAIFGLSCSFSLLLLLGEHFAGLEAERCGRTSPILDSTSAKEYLRRRGSF